MAEMLQADGWIGGTPPIAVVQETQGDIDSEIRRRLGECGCLIVITTPKFSAGSDTDPDEISVSVLVGIAERVRTNRGPTGTQKKAHDLAVVVTAMFRRWAPLSAPWRALEFRDATLVDGPEGLITWQVLFETRIRVASQSFDDA